MRKFFGGDETILYTDSRGGYMNLYLCLKSQNHKKVIEPYMKRKRSILQYVNFNN